jgi:hypothetical protein
MISANEVRHLFHYHAYLKALYGINEFVESPRFPELIDHVDIDNRYTADFHMFLFGALNSLCDALCCDSTTDPDYENMLCDIQENMQEHGMAEWAGTFHFSLLYDNLQLFTQDEQIDWYQRMNNLTDEMPGNVFMDFERFYELYFKTQFFGGGTEYFSRFSNQMRYTLILIYDFDSHTYSEYSPEFFSTFLSFAKKYHEFYKDLKIEIEKRKWVEISA